MLTYEFMRRSLIMGIMIGIVAPCVGYFLVLRRQSVIGDTLSHVALSGAAFGMLTNSYPLLTAMLFTVIASLGIEGLRIKYRHFAELPLSIILSAGVGLASILLSLGNTQGVLSYLFGSLSLVSSQEILLFVMLSVIIFGTIIILYNKLFYITFDEESAYLSGIPTKRINIFFSVLVALTIAISMRIVGVLLISSLMVLPVAASLLIAKSFKAGLVYSMVFGVVSVIIGLILSYYLNLATGGTIVLSALAILLIIIIFQNMTKAYV